MKSEISILPEWLERVGDRPFGLSTLHTRDAKGAISRYADFFPQESQNEIRSQLASGLRSVICQRLLPSSIEGEKQELALEVLFNSNPISSSIRSGKLESIDNYILTGRNEGCNAWTSRSRDYCNPGELPKRLLRPL